MVETWDLAEVLEDLLADHPGFHPEYFPVALLVAHLAQEGEAKLAH
jgi:hypothetical protein